MRIIWKNNCVKNIWTNIPELRFLNSDMWTQKYQLRYVNSEISTQKLELTKFNSENCQLRQLNSENSELTKTNSGLELSSELTFWVLSSLSTHTEFWEVNSESELCLELRAIYSVIFSECRNFVDLLYSTSFIWQNVMFSAMI